MRLLFVLFAQCALLPPLPAQSDFYNPDKIQQIELSFDVADWQYVLDSLATNGDDLLLGDAVINGERYPNVGVRYRGTKSYTTGTDRNPLHIKLDYIKRDRHIDGYTTLKFSNALRDPSLVREVLGYELARKYFPAPLANYAEIKVNGRPYGLYVNVEAIKTGFLNRQFGENAGTLVKARSEVANPPAGCKSNLGGNLEYEEDIRCYLHNWELKSEDGWEDLVELTRVLEQEPDRIGNYLNVDETLAMLAYNNVLVNLSSYSGQQSQNFYLYRDTSGVFRPIIWDLNLNFGSFKNTGKGSDLDLQGLQTLDPLLHANETTKPLIRQLLNNDYYKKRYLSYVRRLLREELKDGQYAARARELQALIRPAFQRDPHAFYEVGAFDRSLTETVGKKSRIPGIVELMDGRVDFLKQHETMTVLPPAIDTVYVKPRRKLMSKPVDVFKVLAAVDRYPKRVRLHYRYGPDAPWQEMPMYDDGKHSDIRKNDGIYGAVVAPLGNDAGLEYYIEAENASLVTFHPTDAPRNVRSVTLAELNE